MDFGDTSEEAAFRAELREWLSSNALRMSTSHFGPPDVDARRSWSVQLAAAGYAGLSWPAEHGGRGASPKIDAIFLDEMARARAVPHLGVIGIGMAGPTIIHWGTEAQRARYLPRILDASEIWCQGFSEPGAGSDLAGITTRAVLDGDHWVVNGQKVWSSYAHLADWCILLVRTDPVAARHQGLSFLLLDMRSPGVEVRPLPQLTGDPEFNEIFLTDVRVPRTSMLGEPGQGWSVAMTTLGAERGTFAISLVASLEAHLREVLDQARRPRRDGVVPAEDVEVRRRLARHWVDIQALRATASRTLSRLAATGDAGADAPGIKLGWSQVAQQLTHLALEIAGDDGLSPTSGSAYAKLRSRGNSIEMGTSEIVRGLIAERALGLPRSR